MIYTYVKQNENMFYAASVNATKDAVLVELGDSAGEQVRVVLDPREAIQLAIRILHETAKIAI